LRRYRCLGLNGHKHGLSRARAENKRKKYRIATMTSVDELSLLDMNPNEQGAMISQSQLSKGVDC
jgi:hypothetical protein